MSQDTSAPFVVRFVAADRGVKAQAEHMAELKATVKSYEDRIDAIRKSA